VALEIRPIRPGFGDGDEGINLAIYGRSLDLLGKSADLTS
jgi:hypothetical protein